MSKSNINLISEKIKNSLNVPETFRVQLISGRFFYFRFRLSFFHSLNPIASFLTWFRHDFPKFLSR